MEHFVLIIHLILTISLIGLILIQRSEGGGLGLGTGGGGMGSFASAQSTKSAITKATTIVAICFFATSLILAIMAARGDHNKSILDSAPITAEGTETKPVAPPVPAIGGVPTTNNSSQAPAQATTTTPAPVVPKPESKPTEAPKVPLAP